MNKSFCKSGRIDAEYYQPLYDLYEELVNNYQNGKEIISEICNIQDTNYQPEPIREYKYIELSNIGKYGNIEDFTKGEGYELPTRARRIVATGDVIVSSIEGSCYGRI